jgi:hypothetical protein
MNEQSDKSLLLSDANEMKANLFSGAVHPLAIFTSSGRKITQTVLQKPPRLSHLPCDLF